jgi:hypothetical protein
MSILYSVLFYKRVYEPIATALSEATLLGLMYSKLMIESHRVDSKVYSNMYVLSA